MDVVATARYIRQSPRKIRLVTEAVKGKAPAEAQAQLSLMNQKAAKVVADVLQSAVANATHNFKLPKESLRIRTLEVGEGPTLKRYRSRSRGMANQVHKRMAHVRVVLTDEVAAAPKARSQKIDGRRQDAEKTKPAEPRNTSKSATGNVEKDKE